MINFTKRELLWGPPLDMHGLLKTCYPTIKTKTAIAMDTATSHKLSHILEAMKTQHLRKKSSLYDRWAILRILELLQLISFSHII